MCFKHVFTQSAVSSLCFCSINIYLFLFQNTMLYLLFSVFTFNLNSLTLYFLCFLWKKADFYRFWYVEFEYDFMSLLSRYKLKSIDVFYFLILVFPTQVVCYMWDIYYKIKYNGAVCCHICTKTTNVATSFGERNATPRPRHSAAKQAASVVVATRNAMSIVRPIP